jgi:quercetin dioxygenase-like cupin family protein
MKILAATLIALSFFAAGSAQSQAQAEAGSDAAPTSSLQDSQSVKITRSGSQPSAKGPTEHVTGPARIDPLFSANTPSHTSGGSVTFESGARTAWHSHPLGQTLIVTAGRGWVQQWGGQVEEIREGDVVWIPPNQRH